MFREKTELLALYNAMNGSNYTNIEDLEIVTLEDVVYMSMKNDVSFLLGDILNLWEHQSSFNPNIPIRGLFYFARLYKRYIQAEDINIYGSALKKLPFPKYLVFYNGLRDEPDRMELKLSDAFLHETEGNLTSDSEPCLEVKAEMININLGRNQELMEQCIRLKEYAIFVAKIREFLACGMNAEEAAGKAVDECIGNGILEDVLSENKAEVVELFLTEYDEQKHMEMERKEQFEAGFWKKLISLVCRKLSKGKTVQEIAEMLEEEETVISCICSAAKKYAPEYDTDKIYEEIEDKLTTEHF